jgi:hypothetical protein
VVNYRRLLSHDGITLADLREALQARGRAWSKAELIDRVAASAVKPSELLGVLDKGRLAGLCAALGLRVSGSKPELIDRLVNFYDDLTFAERVAKDERAERYANYEFVNADREVQRLPAEKRGAPCQVICPGRHRRAVRNSVRYSSDDAAGSRRRPFAPGPAACRRLASRSR